MQVILTPSNGKLALIVDTITGNILREIEIPPELQGEKNRPYGITKDFEGNWYISNWDRIGCFDSDFNFKYAIKNLPENIHQIQYDEPSDELWVCATSIDSLLAINLKDQSVRRFCLLTNAWVALDAPGSDTQHFSSLRWHGSYLYVLAHKFGKESSCMVTYDRGMEPQGAWSAGLESHSICEFNGHNFIVDSRGGAIIGNNGMGLPISESSLYSAQRDTLYDAGNTGKHYARGMAINERGIAVVSEFDFGNISTRDNGNISIRLFNIPDREYIKEINLFGTGNIQDIQIYSEEDVVIPNDALLYQRVIDRLNTLIAPILNGEHYNNDDRIPYDPERNKPDLISRFTKLSNALIDISAQKNLKRLTLGIEKEAENLLNELLPQEWKRSGGFWYPAKNGFMDWHTNCESPGMRIYFVWCEEGGKSRFLHSPNGKTISEKIEPAGWSINAFNVGGKRAPLWHSVDSGDTNRISFGFKMRAA